MNQSLQNLQRWLQSVITHPGGVAAGLQSEAAQSQLAVAPDDVEQVVSRSRRLTSAQRLAVYANAYYARLAECLEADFPIFRQTVGDEAFADFVFAYLQSHPSHSYTLGQLGANFAAFLDETKPVDEYDARKPPGCNPVASAWPDFLIDLAHLERACSEVFDGPGVERGRGRESFSATRVENRERDPENDSRPLSAEGQSVLTAPVVAWSPDQATPPTEGLQAAPPETYGRNIVRGQETRAQHGVLTADDLRAIDPDRWPDARLQLAPCVRLMEFRFPVNAYYTAMKRGTDAPGSHALRGSPMSRRSASQIESSNAAGVSSTQSVDAGRSHAERGNEIQPPIPAAAPSWLALTRRDFVVRRYELTHPQFVLLSALHRGETVGKAVLAAAELYELDAQRGRESFSTTRIDNGRRDHENDSRPLSRTDQFAAELREWFATWAAAPMFVKVVLHGQ